MKESDLRSPWFLSLLSVIMITGVLISNVAASVAFIIPIGNSSFFFALTCAFFVYALVYCTSDIISETFGMKASRRISWLAFGANIVMIGCFFLGAGMAGFLNADKVTNPNFLEPFRFGLPVDDNTIDSTWGALNAFRIIISTTPFIFIGGILGTQISSYVNDVIFLKMKQKHGDRLFGTRAIVSSIVGELIDSCFFVSVAFGLPLLLAPQYAKAGWHVIPVMILSQTLWKLVVELVALPIFTKPLVKWIKTKAPGLYDDTPVNIFGFNTNKGLT